MIKIGLDIGSTTLKSVVLDEAGNIVYKNYERHLSKIAEKTIALLETLKEKFSNEKDFRICISGSAGMGFASKIGIPFIQEVYSTRISVKKTLPDTDVVIELGGEDAKIIFLTGMSEVRMNGSCAGGTGAFIDQMATLLNISPDDMNDLAKEYNKIYSIASRCGVFAKSDIQPLLNQGASKPDICASILLAVVNQTISGLAQGREIEGNVTYLGGPLTFFSELRKFFDKTLSLTGTCPDNSLYYVAYGAALSLENSEDSPRFDLDDVIEKIKKAESTATYKSVPPLFSSKEEYDAFKARHGDCEITESVLPDDKTAYLGIDAGSTTVKCAVIDKDGKIIFKRYIKGTGNPVPAVKGFLTELYEKYPDIRIAASAATGYGEEIIKNAFHLDTGIVETIAHYEAAKSYDPKVDFIIDIGGQDIKCFKIKNGTIDNIFLNEACSSGCGSFLQTFAAALGYSNDEFDNLALFADNPVNLGSRCTVFMNSSVKQAQKDGASIENISAGLSISVVKNALYKVIRASSASALGEHIVVQGGTFINESVLRAFELETGSNVTRPAIAGLMGAYGAALYAKKKYPADTGHTSTVLTADELKVFEHKVSAITCKGCQNACRLTINSFNDGRKFIGGNRCEKPLIAQNGGKLKERHNLYECKRELISSYKNFVGELETIHIPLGLNMYEMYPFWYTFFKTLGFGVANSGMSTRKIYIKGQNTIPSDTICYPAKLIHGHIETLLEDGAKHIFYPCLSYNFDEGLGDNNYNCPVVAYYPEVISSNMKSLKDVHFIKTYIGIHRRKEFPAKMLEMLQGEFPQYSARLSLKDVKRASDAAYDEYYEHMKRIRKKGKEYVELAKTNGLPLIILCGRPYHIDPEINHGIDNLICDLNAVIVSEDGISDNVKRFPTTVLNQWTYHSRLYAAAKYVCESDYDKINLIQLVSFGCGVDAITTDEVRKILEEKDKIYTQIKIDEITNLGAVNIRVRSLFSALGLNE